MLDFQYKFLKLSNFILVSLSFNGIAPKRLHTTTVPVSQRNSARLAGCVVKSMRPIIKTKMFVYQIKANLVEKILFGKSHL